jgi:hypothetical protein
MYLRAADKPPLGRRVTAGRGSAVGMAALASAAAASRLLGAVSSRESPSRAAKTLAISRIHGETPCRTAVVSHATGKSEISTHNAVIDDGTDMYIPSPPGPPMWNAYWCSGCITINLVGDGGSLVGKCICCQSEDDSWKNSIMLDPDEFEEAQKHRGMKYPNKEIVNNVLDSNRILNRSLNSDFSGGVGEDDDDDEEMTSNPYNGEGDDDNSDINSATDGEVSKFSFYDRLNHYMDRMSITQNNRMAVELAVMVEAGSTMREMGTMKKDAKEKSFYESYMDLIMEMPDEYFDDSSVRKSMLERFKGARNGTMTAESLYRKYETELTALRKFACTVTGIGNLHKLPSGTTQLKQVKGPLIAKMWSEKFPDRQDVNYNDQGSVNSKIPPMFWLEDSKCKYILSCFVHKDNKDISTKPTTLPPGQSRKQQ